MRVGRGCHICAFALALGLYRQKCVAGPRQGRRLAELALSTGKFKRGKAFGAHILTSKSRKRKRRLKGTTLVSKADQKKLRTMLP